MLNILIVEDMALVADRIADLCNDYFGNCNIQIASSSEMALKRLTTHQYDLLLLDLNLNGEDGYELLSHKHTNSLHTVIITASPEKAAQAFDYGVADFITKPVSEKRFNQAMQRFTSFANKSNTGLCQLSVKSRGKLSFIPIDNIHFIKADSNYCEIITKSNESFLHDKSMEQLTKLLEGQFIRIHRSYLVNESYIESVITHGSGKYSAVLKSGEQLPLSRSVYREKFK